MPSKYLGSIGGLEAHAFSENGKYRDGGLSRQLHMTRYRVLESGKPIYCTAVSPDTNKREEHNPHDALPTTIHFAIIDKKTGDVHYALTTAKYSKEFGVPLENRFSPNGYPSGAELDEFVSLFLRKNYGVDKEVGSRRIAEIYRHIRNPDSKLRGLKSLGARLALYAATYQHLVRDPLQEGITPTDLWVWDAIPKYADKYAYVSGVYRDLTIDGKDGKNWVPTWLHKLKLRKVDGVEHCFLDGNQVTRSLPVLHPPKKGFGPENRGKIQPVGMIDGLVDVRRAEYLIKKHPYLFPNGNMEDLGHRMGQRAAMGVVGYRAFKDHHKFNIISNILNSLSHLVTRTSPWSLEKENKKANHSLLVTDLHPLYETDI